MNIVFPKKATKPLYYKIHVSYIIELFSAMGWNVSYTDDDTTVDGSKFLVRVNGQNVLFDFCDFSSETVRWTEPYFKLHYHESREYAENVRPFPPVSFYDWTQYATLSDEVQYSACGVIAYRQSPYGGAVERRLLLGSILHDYFKDLLDTRNLPQEEYWRSVQGDLVQVFAPGAREGILDRGQLQCMALGECTVSPKITDQLPGERLVPGFHYVMCRSDFSDVPTIIKDLERNPSVCKAIGENAKKLFVQTCTPDALNLYMNKELR